MSAPEEWIHMRVVLATIIGARASVGWNGILGYDDAYTPSDSR